jgi:hypothetical protein
VRDDAVRVEALSVLSGFRTEFYRCLTARADVLFEVADALLCPMDRSPFVWPSVYARACWF